LHRIVFTVRTKLFGAMDPIQLMVGYDEQWHPLALHSSRNGLRGACDLRDDVRSCTVIVEAVGPAYGRIQVFALLPSGSRLGPVIERSIKADEANLAVRAKAVVNLW